MRQERRATNMISIYSSAKLFKIHLTNEDKWVQLKPGEGNGNPLQHFCLGNLVDRGALWATVHGVAESEMTRRLST